MWEERFGLPGNMSEGEYQLEIGIETGVKEIGNIQLAIEGNKDGYYPMGKLTVERGDKEMESLLKFNECIAICNFDYLPEGLEAKYDRYKPDGKPYLIPREFLSGIFEQYQIPEPTRQWLVQGLRR